MRKHILLAVVMVMSVSAVSKETVKTLVQRAAEVHKKLIGVVDKDWLDQADTFVKKAPNSVALEPYLSEVSKGGGGFLSQGADDLKLLKKMHQSVRHGHWEKVRDHLPGLKLKGPEPVSKDQTPQIKAPDTPERALAYVLDHQIWELYQKGIVQMDPYLKVLEKEIDRLSSEIVLRFQKYRGELEKAASIQSS